MNEGKALERPDLRLQVNGSGPQGWETGGKPERRGGATGIRSRMKYV